MNVRLSSEEAELFAKANREAKAFAFKRKRRREVIRIWWCKQHRAERSYKDDLGLQLCWKAEHLLVNDTKPCRMVEMQLSPDDALVILDMASFLDVFNSVPALRRFKT